MTRPKANGPCVLVTDASRGSAVAIIRSLGRQGYRVIASDARPRSPGFRSVFASGTLLYPSPEREPTEFVAAMLDAARTHGVDLIIPVTDPTILPLSEARDSFEGICPLALPQASALAAAWDKLYTLELARRLRVPVPATYLVETVSDACDCSTDLGWPVVVKPRYSRRYRGHSGIEKFAVSYAENTVQLKERMRHLEGRCPVLLQRYHHGSGVGVELLMQEGRPLAAFQHLRLREMPVHGGPSAFRESMPLDPRLYAHSVALLADLRWTGLAMVEFKVGFEGEQLMEINGRIWGSLALAVHSGMDFPKLLAELWLQDRAAIPPIPNQSYQTGVRCRNLELDLAWIMTTLLRRRRNSLLEGPRRCDALAAMLQLLNPLYRCDILSLADPRPGLAELMNIAAKAMHKLNLNPRPTSTHV